MRMLLFYTPKSPYARTARVALREWGLLAITQERLAANREPDNPVLEFSAVGRVPTLVHGSLVITESRSVFAYIKHSAHKMESRAVETIDWSSVVEEGQILGFLEGIAVRVREMRRTPPERSESLLNVERDRMHRCLDHLDTVSTKQSFPTVKEFRSAALACALQLMDTHDFCVNWQDRYPALASWFNGQIARPSMQETFV